MLGFDRSLVMRTVIRPQPFGSEARNAAVRREDLGLGRSVSERTISPDGLVATSPLFDQHLGLLRCVKELAIKQSVPKLSTEALGAVILSG